MSDKQEVTVMYALSSIGKSRIATVIADKYNLSPARNSGSSYTHVFTDEYCEQQSVNDLDVMRAALSKALGLPVANSGNESFTAHTECSKSCEMTLDLTNQDAFVAQLSAIHSEMKEAVIERDLKQDVIKLMQWISNAITQLGMTPQEAYFKGFNLYAFAERLNPDYCTIHLVDNSPSSYGQITVIAEAARAFGLKVH